MLDHVCRLRNGLGTNIACMLIQGCNIEQLVRLAFACTNLVILAWKQVPTMTRIVRAFAFSSPWPRSSSACKLCLSTLAFTICLCFDGACAQLFSGAMMPLLVAVLDLKSQMLGGTAGGLSLEDLDAFFDGVGDLTAWLTSLTSNFEEVCWLALAHLRALASLCLSTDQTRSSLFLKSHGILWMISHSPYS